MDFYVLNWQLGHELLQKQWPRKHKEREGFMGNSLVTTMKSEKFLKILTVLILTKWWWKTMRISKRAFLSNAYFIQAWLCRLCGITNRYLFISHMLKSPCNFTVSRLTECMPFACMTIFLSTKCMRREINTCTFKKTH